MGHDYIYRNANLLSTIDKDIIKAKTIDGALSGDITKALKKYIRPNDLYNSRRPGIISRNNDQVAELKSTLLLFQKEYMIYNKFDDKGFYKGTTLISCRYSKSPFARDLLMCDDTKCTNSFDYTIMILLCFDEMEIDSF